MLTYGRRLSHYLGMTGPDAIRIIQSLEISQRQFSRLVGLHPNSVTKWANGGELSGPAETLLLLLEERPELVSVLKKVRGAAP